MTNLLLFVAAPAVVLLIAAVVVGFGLAARRAKSEGDPSPVVKTTLVVAAGWAGISTIGALVALLVPLLSPSVEVTVPTREFWPELPEGMEIEGMSARIEGGGFTSATLALTDLSVPARILIGLGGVFAWLVPGAVATLLAVACFQLLAGRAFAPVVARVTMTTAVIVAVGGIATQVLGDIGASIAASEALRWSGAAYPDVPGIDHPLTAWWPAPALLIELPFWPLAAGLGLAALAAVFRYGSVLQRDTEGLV